MEVEVKVLISDEHWENIKKRIPLTVDDKKREVWFFETPELSLKRQEVVLRARVNQKKKKAESTAKWRRWVSPFVPVRDVWEVPEGVAIERWTVGEESVIEVSKRGQCQEVVLGEIQDWLTADGIEAEALEGGKTAWALTRFTRRQ